MSPRSNEPPTASEMQEMHPPIPGEDCACRVEEGECIILCPLHDAAPDMYQALEWVVDFLERTNKRGVARPIRAVLAKATGKDAS